MNSFGIYTLANDNVYDQLVALLNSIEVNVDANIPICIIPYNQQLNLIKQEISSRPNVRLFEDWDIINRWDKFVDRVWEVHPRAKQSKLSHPGWYRGFVHRKYAAFNGDFDKFIFYDADSLAMKPVNDIISKLDNYQLVFDDWEHAKPKENTDIIFEKVINKYPLFDKDKLHLRIHCNSLMASHKDLFDKNDLKYLEKHLIEEKEIEWINHNFWWSSSALLNYMTIDGKHSIFNYTLSPEYKDRTGNCANADEFVNIDNILYNKDGLKPIYRLHYMSYSANDFTRLCRGEDVDIRYKYEFLHYRFLKEPEKKPKYLKSENITDKANRFINKAVQKMKRVIA